MPVVVECRCGQAFQAPDHLIGSRVPCPVCGQVIEIHSERTSGSGDASSHNWTLTAAIAGTVAVLFLLAVAVGVSLVVKTLAGSSAAKKPAVADESLNPTRKDSEVATSAAPASLPAPSSSGQSAASQPLAEQIPPVASVDHAQGETLTFGEGRFQLWIPTKSLPQEKVQDAESDDGKYYFSDFTLPDGMILKVLVISGSSAAHEKGLIDIYRKQGGSPKSPLEVPTDAIMQHGVAGYGENRKAQKYTKAFRKRVFYHADRAIMFSFVGTDSQVFSPEVDYCFQSLTFGSPTQE